MGQRVLLPKLMICFINLYLVRQLYNELLGTLILFTSSLPIRFIKRSMILLMKRLQQMNYQNQSNEPPAQEIRSQTHPNTLNCSSIPPSLVPEVITQVIQDKQQDKDIQIIEIIPRPQDVPVKKKRGRKPKSQAQKVPPKPKKKKSVYCDKCGLQGKKKQFLRCKLCEKSTHPKCMQSDKELKPKKYVCKQCKQKQKIKKWKNKQQRTSQKLKEKAKYKKNTPFGNRSLFQFRRQVIDQEDPKSIRKQFQPKKYPIPLAGQQHLRQLLLIGNFLTSFKEQFEGTSIDRRTLSEFIKQPNMDWVNRLMSQILSMYLKDILEKSKTQNVKIVNQNSFIGLVIFLKQNQFLKDLIHLVWPQILRHIVNVPSIELAFMDPQLDKLITLLAKNGPQQFINFKVQERLKILSSLFQGLYQVDYFHDLLNQKSQKMQDLSKQKNEILVESKNNQMQIQELQLKFGKLDVQDFFKREDKSRKDIQARQTLQKLIKRNQQIQQRVNFIIDQMPFITTNFHFLGYDSQQRQHFFGRSESNRIFIRQGNNWNYYEGQQIKEFLDCLSHRSSSQSALCKTLKNYLGNYINLSKQQQIFQQETQCKVFDYSCFNLTVLKQTLLLTVKKFTEYLTSRRSRWCKSEQLPKYLQDIQRVDDPIDLPYLVNKFHEKFLFVESIREQRQDDQYQIKKSELTIDQEFILFQDKIRRTPVRLWGISSQRFKKFFIQYNSGCNTLTGVYLSLWVFSSIILKYIERRAAFLQQQLNSKKNNKNQTQEDYEFIQQKFEKLRKYHQRRRSSRNKKTSVTDKQKSDYSDEENDQMCFQCGEYGDMVCCDSCPNVFHMECIGLKQIPEGSWFCYKCHQSQLFKRTTRSKMRLQKNRQLQ